MNLAMPAAVQRQAKKNPAVIGALTPRRGSKNGHKGPQAKVIMHHLKKSAKPRIHVSRIPARKLCCAQRRPSLAGIRQPLPAFRIRRGLAQLAKTKRTDAIGKAIGARQTFGEALPHEVERIMLRAHVHLDMLARGLVPDADEETHDYLCHIVGVAQVRVCDIGTANGKTGIDRANELLTTLNAAARAMLRARKRHQATGKWRLDGPAIDPLRASSPMQMEQAQTVRLAKLKAQAGVA